VALGHQQVGHPWNKYPFLVSRKEDEKVCNDYKKKKKKKKKKKRIGRNIVE
jgi:hypothetical protein